MVLFKPEKNTRDAVMTVMRNSTYGRESSYRKQGHDHHSAPAIFVLTGKLFGSDAVVKDYYSNQLILQQPTDILPFNFFTIKEAFLRKQKKKIPTTQ